MPYSRTPLGEIVKKINDSTGVCEELVDSNGASLSSVFLTPPQVASTQALVSRAWNVGRGQGLKIAFCGDSMTFLTAEYGMALTMSSTPAGICQSGIFAKWGTVTGGTLQWDGSRYLTYTASGDTAGAAVDVSLGGVFTLYSGNGTSWVLTTTTPRLFDGSAATVTLTAGTYRNRRLGFAFVVDALLGGCNTIKLFGVGGDRSVDVARRTQQVLDWAPDVVCELFGTNDLPASVTPDAAMVYRKQVWDAWKSAGLPVVSGVIPPRWASTDSANYSATNQARLIRMGELLSAEAAARSNVVIIDSYSGAVDTTASNGTARTSWTSDGLHPAGPLAWYLGCQFADAVATVVPRAKVIPRAGLGAQYSATENPQGNLISSGQGAFINTGGTAGTGATVAAAWAASAYASGAVCLNTTLGYAYYTPNGGTSSGAAPVHGAGTVADAGGVQWTFLTDGASVGLAAGVSCQRAAGSFAIVYCFKVADPEGATWQEAFISNFATGEASTFWLYPSSLTLANITLGTDKLVMSVETEAIGNGCTGLEIDYVIGGGVSAGNNVLTNRSCGGVLQGLRNRRLNLTTEPMDTLADMTSLQPRILMYGSAGCAFRARARNLVVKKV